MSDNATLGLRPINLPRLGLRERQRAARIDSILEAAFELIVEVGYDRLTMDDLADRVGISRQTLYHHFSSKEEIALRAIVSLFEQGIQAIRSVDQSLLPGERLRWVVRYLLESRFSPATAAFVRVRHSLMPLKSHPDYQSAFQRRAEALEELVIAAQKAGDIRSDFASRLVVQMLLGLISDTYYEAIIADGSATPADVINSVIDLFFTGMAPKA